MNAFSLRVCRAVLFIICLAQGMRVNAQTGQQPDTLQLTLEKAKNLFVTKNLSLLASHFDIDISKALKVQSKYLDNPMLNTDQNLYDGEFFRHDETHGQVYIQLMQLIKTAGKRKKIIQLSEDNVLSAEQQFSDVLRNLSYLLSTDFNELLRLQSSSELYRNELSSLQQLRNAMDQQFNAGNISAKENLRVKGLYFSTEAEQVEIEKQMDDLQKEIRTLLQLDASSLVQPISNDNNLEARNLPSLQQLLDSAKTNRPDLKLAQLTLTSQEHNVSFQKALAVPDLNVGVEYDKANSYVPNYWGLAVSLPLPVFNRNKGNIKAAEFSVEQARILQMQSNARVEQEVIAAYNKFNRIMYIWNQETGPLDEQYDRMLENVTNSYRQRQIGLLEYIDFFQSYKEVKLKRIQQRADLSNAAAELNFTTGYHFI